MYTLSTLHNVRRRLGLAAGDTADDPRLLSALQAAAAAIERIAGRRFTPYSTTLDHTVTDPRTLLLDGDLLELTALTNGDGGDIPLSAVLTLPDTNGERPFGILRLTGGGVFVWQETPLRAVRVTGLWGWHDRWSAAWQDSADSVADNPLSSGATLITVSDADGVDAGGQSPRFQVGQLLRIESEYLRVLSVDAVGNQLTVQRGVSGTTAAQHPQNSVIDGFRPAQEVEMLALQWAAWLYQEADTPPAENTPAHLITAARALRRVAVKA